MNRMLLAIVIALGVLLALAAAGCQGSATTDAGVTADQPAAALGRAHDVDDDGDDDDDEVEIPLGEVPESVRQAALDAVPGLVLESAERETENGVVVYDLEGTVGGLEHEVEVTAAGEVIEIEVGEDDDDD